MYVYVHSPCSHTLHLPRTRKNLKIFHKAQGRQFISGTIQYMIWLIEPLYLFIAECLLGHAQCTTMNRIESFVLFHYIHWLNELVCMCLSGSALSVRDYWEFEVRKSISIGQRSFLFKSGWKVNSQNWLIKYKQRNSSGNSPITMEWSVTSVTSRELWNWHLNHGYGFCLLIESRIWTVMANPITPSQLLLLLLLLLQVMLLLLVWLQVFLWWDSACTNASGRLT